MEIEGFKEIPNQFGFKKVAYLAKNITPKYKEDLFILIMFYFSFQPLYKL